MSLLSRMRQARATPTARPLLWDGGLGTGLIARGLDLTREPPEAWLLSRPDDVRAVHREFAAAGADVLQTNTFGLLRHRVTAGSPLAADWRQLARLGVALAREAAAGLAHVVASLGPTVARDVEPARLADLAGELALELSDAGAEALHLETSCDATELRTVMQAVRDAAPQLPLLVSVTVSVGQSGLETPLGVPLSRMLQVLDASLPEAVGVNCSLHVRRIRPAVAALAEWADGRLPILAQPQVDQPAPDCKRPASPQLPEQFARDLLLLLDEGATLLGGCCGCRGEHLAAVRSLLDAA